MWSWDYARAADFLIRHRWHLERAIDLLKQAKIQTAKDHALETEEDDFSDDELRENEIRKGTQDQNLIGLMLKAVKGTGQRDDVLELRASIETAPPDKRLESGYWLNRARFEALQNHVQDALAYYQRALQTRVEAPKPSRGKWRDELTDEARALWTTQGGSDAAWTLWSRIATNNAQGTWEKASKTIPAFELTDLGGRTWRLKDLNGKTVLINVWATWCGPCQTEMPHVQKFYEKIKDRSDLQLLTFNIDEDLGMVAPYVKAKGYTFPVLPAYSTVVTLLDDFAIPQNWIVDGRGTWRWRQIGWSSISDSDFQKDLIDHLELARR
jgi:thiol-disulfide isomerase/thioredoxin